MNQEKKYCGVDVSSDVLDLCYQDGSGDKHHLQVSNNKKGFQQLLKSCGKDLHYVMESTGVYHMQFMFYLHENGCVYSVVNALQIRRYIQMHLERNKSDKKDAKRICEYGIERHPQPSEMPDSAYFECRTINNAIQDFTKEITRISNQIHALKRSGVAAQEVIKCYEKMVKKMRQEKEKLEVHLSEKLKAWQPELLSQVSSVKGIGRRAAAELIIYTKSFKGMENYKQLISYSGLSPVEYSRLVQIRSAREIL